MDDVKVIAFYLPQFHRVKENDEWWGEGFTDWTSTQNAVPFFEGHYQPHIPLNHFYYDLLEKKTMMWQADLMKTYKVDGMCFYHYWFEKGRQILEKPAENLLVWKDVDMPFCFSWANETWARSWSNIKGKNVWSCVDEKRDDRETVLLKQDYGEINEWKAHFEYLLPFFRDKRYIKIDGKPVFLIYRADLMGCIDEMLEEWRKWSVEEGFPGLYVLGSRGNRAEYSCLDGELFIEPTRNEIPYFIREDEVSRVSYNEIWGSILNRSEKRRNVYYSGFVGYDDTPRQGKGGMVVENSSPQLFGRYLAELIAKNYVKGNNLIFINAWNEWGEGMHLEPDQEFGFAFLEQISNAKVNFEQFISYYRYRDDEKRFMVNDKQKYELYLNDLDCWMDLREKNLFLSKWFTDRNIDKIAVYGYGIMGRHLINELIQTDVKVCYLIDQNKSNINVDIPVYTPSEKLPEVDLIVVAAYYYFEDIKNGLASDMKVVPLDEIIHSIDLASE